MPKDYILLPRVLRGAFLLIYSLLQTYTYFSDNPQVFHTHFSSAVWDYRAKVSYCGAFSGKKARFASAVWE
jgi:hypothetical protein